MAIEKNTRIYLRV